MNGRGDIRGLSHIKIKRMNTAPVPLALCFRQPLRFISRRAIIQKKRR